MGIRKHACHSTRVESAGEINWTVVKRITQVASERTQERWLEFCKGRTTRQIEAEVKEAQRKNRDRPRKEGDSMPTLRLRVSFELAPEEHDLVEKALGKVTSELGEKLGGGRLDPKDALLFMARRMLETDPAQTPEGRREKEESLYTILYHSCPSCRKASVQTVDGPVEIDRAIVERVEEEAEKVTSGLRRSSILTPRKRRTSRRLRRNSTSRTPRR